MSGRGRHQDRDGSGEGNSCSPGVMEGASGTVLELLLEQKRVQQEQQRGKEGRACRAPEGNGRAKDPNG